MRNRFVALLLALSFFVGLPSGAWAEELETSENTILHVDVAASLNQGWPSSMGDIEKRLDPERAYLVIVTEPPGALIDFRSLDHIRKSLFATSSGDRSDIGHNMFGWSCPRTLNGARKGFTSHSGEFSGQSTSLLTGGWGLSGLFAVYTDGGLLSAEKNDTRSIGSRLFEPPLALVALVQEVSDQDCQAVVDFVEKDAHVDDVTHRYPAQNFGLSLRPEKLEGGGCGTTAMTALAEGHFLSEVSPAFWREVRVPIRLMGNPNAKLPEATQIVFPVKIAKGRAISLPVLLASNWDEKGPSVTLKTMDPEMQLLFYRTVIEELLSLKASSSASILGLDEFGLSNIKSQLHREARHSGILEGILGMGQFVKDADPIDETFDAQAKTVVKLSRAWIKDKIKAGYMVERPVWGNQLAIIVKRP